MADEGADEWGDAEEQAWCLTIRPTVMEYLRRQGVVHGRVGDLPAWHTAPYVSVWAIESLKRPGAVGWWVVCGDLPTDYCSSDQCSNPRQAIRRIAESWKKALIDFRLGDEAIGSTGIPISFAQLLSARAELLLGYTDYDSLWTDDEHESANRN